MNDRVSAAFEGRGQSISTAVYKASTVGLCALRVVQYSREWGRPPVNQDREGRLAEECCCIQPLEAEQNQAFLMEMFILCGVVWSILAGSVSVIVSSMLIQQK